MELFCLNVPETQVTNLMTSTKLSDVSVIWTQDLNGIIRDHDRSLSQEKFGQIVSEIWNQDVMEAKRFTYRKEGRVFHPKPIFSRFIHVLSKLVSQCLWTSPSHDLLTDFNVRYLDMGRIQAEVRLHASDVVKLTITEYVYSTFEMLKLSRWRHVTFNLLQWI